MENQAARQMAEAATELVKVVKETKEELGEAAVLFTQSVYRSTLSKRDLFAMEAMKALIHSKFSTSSAALGQASYQIADEMVQRSSTPPTTDQENGQEG